MLKKTLKWFYIVLCPFPSFRQNTGHRILQYVRKYIQCIIGLPRIVKTLRDVDYKLNLLCDYYFDVRQAHPATGGLREFQKLGVNLLARFVEVCESRGIEYWLDFGSLLGAFRHCGFVPWDDDVDVSMTIDSMHKLLDCRAEFSKWDMRLVDNWVPGKMFRLVYNGKSDAFLDIYGYECRTSQMRLLIPASVRAIAPVPNGVIFPLRRLKFEGLEVYAPNRVEEYLCCRYGNYMTFPHHAHEELGHVYVSPYKDFLEDIEENVDD